MRLKTGVVSLTIGAAMLTTGKAKSPFAACVSGAAKAQNEQGS